MLFCRTHRISFSQGLMYHANARQFRRAGWDSLFLQDYLPTRKTDYSPLSPWTTFCQVIGYTAISTYMLLILKPTSHGHKLSCKYMYLGLKMHLQKLWTERCLGKNWCFYRIIYGSRDSLIPMTRWPAAMFNIHSLLFRQKIDVGTGLFL